MKFQCFHQCRITVLLLSILFVLVVPFSASPQSWEEISIPGGYPDMIYQSPSNPEKLLIFGRRGFWGSTDGGENFTLYNDSLHYAMLPLFTSSYAHPDTLLTLSFRNNGVLYLSPDAGVSWEEHPVSVDTVGYFNGGPVMAPWNSTIYLPTNEGLFVSTNLGDSWSSFPNFLSCNAVCFHPTSPQIIYVSGQYVEESSGVFASYDQGLSWQLIYDALPRELTIHPEHPSQILATFLDYSHPPSNRVYHISPDGGNEWTILETDGAIVTYAHDGTLHKYSLENPSRSIDAGQTWTPLFAEGGSWPLASTSMDPTPFPAFAHPTQSDALYCFRSGLLFRTTNGGLDWERIGEGYTEATLLSLTIHPAQPGTLFVTNKVSGLWKSEDHAESWSHVTPTTWRRYLISWQNPAIHHRWGVWGNEEVGILNRLERSVDGGETWQDIIADQFGSRTSFELYSFWMSGPDADTLLVSFEHLQSDDYPNSYYSTDAGENWSPLNQIRSRYGSFIPDPTNTQCLYFQNERFSTLYRSDDGGLNYTQIQDDFQARNLYVHPVTGDLYGIEDDALILSSVDHGETFNTEPSPADYVYCATYYPTSPSAILAATSDGIQYSVDMGVNWRTIHAGLTGGSSFIQVNNDLEVYRGTGGGKLWKGTDAIFLDVPHESQSLPDPLHILSTAPNPFNGQTRITYTIPQAGQVTLQVFDLLGREVTRLDQPHQSAGQHSTTWNTSSLGLASGTYILRLTQGEQQVSTRAVLVK
ncbi:T9SS type A sorting domain-containing protein [bacterium]|nr:T9SS type A sorting domain-containing protein [bacterium]